MHWRQWLPRAVVLGFLAVTAVLGAGNTPEFAQVIVPKTFWRNHEFWTNRQIVYNDRNVAYVNATLEFLEELAAAEGPQRFGLSDEQIAMARAKTVARQLRTFEKGEMLGYKYGRVLQEGQAVLNPDGSLKETSP